ncbi:TPA: FUSC family protein [Pseudomonas aeruginosa]|uniref:FUSC family protein n=1 Tax=Pseudomonas aeruginosa TaxID=287 RepID=UPI0003B9470F|nr:FUSC family protein [Pseudomonas aeruginosa]EKT9493067.1 FUSC family protein [Pseudomonas aeruginosa]ERY35586.1 hypothetical protein Q067_02221 [Pseudomonas aeruginosa BL13]MBH4028434.1 FUSC family protein [Pseudomonas aeruginosa]MBV5530596.1 FUSC family protein [Pseudomonas aeruginosa]MCS8095363.1 FUSC family protein [Pseudomonas aeruginosa]
MLSALNRQVLIFSTKSYLAAMIALYIAFSMGLSNPFWTVITTYIVSQPKAGAVVSKAIYRLIGTVAGASMALFLVPPLVQSQVLLAMTLSLWLGLCVFLATIDRTSRSYLFVMAGVTASVVAFPCLGEPMSIFDVAVARVEEITLGILCATVVHTVFWPESSAKLLIDEVEKTLDSAMRWTAGNLTPNRPEPIDAETRKLAVAVNGIHDLLTHARFELGGGEMHSDVFSALLVQLERLLPVSADIGSLLAEMGPEQLSPQLTETLSAVRALLDVPQNATTDVKQQLLQRCAIRAARLEPNMSWHATMELSIYARLSELLGIVEACRELHAATLVARAGTQFVSNFQTHKTEPRILEHDYFRALAIACSATFCLFTANCLWIVSGWSDGTNAVMMAGVFYAVYSGFGDPALALKNKFVGVVIRMLVGAIYVTLILPSAEGFEMFAVMLSPVLIVSGALLTLPRYSALAFNLIVGLSSPYIISNQFTGNLMGYLNNGLATLTGIAYALIIMTAVQPIWLKNAADRLMRAVYVDIAQRKYMDQIRWRSNMMHRIALLVSNAVRSDEELGQSFDGLREYRTGCLLAELNRSQNDSAVPLKNDIARILDETAQHYARLASGDYRPPAITVREHIDNALALSLEQSSPSALLVRSLSDLRRHLFPYQGQTG